MEGEVEFNIKIETPEDISGELYGLVGDFISEDEEQLSNLFGELLEMKRAAFMVEIAAPVRIVKDTDDLLRGAGYQVFISMDFEPVDELKEELEEKYTEEVIVAAAVFILLHEAFLEVARLADADVCFQVLCGLMFGYQVRNIIGYIENISSNTNPR